MFTQGIEKDHMLTSRQPAGSEHGLAYDHGTSSVCKEEDAVSLAATSPASSPEPQPRRHLRVPTAQEVPPKQQTTCHDEGTCQLSDYVTEIEYELRCRNAGNQPPYLSPMSTSQHSRDSTPTSTDEMDDASPGASRLPPHLACLTWPELAHLGVPSSLWPPRQGQIVQLVASDTEDDIDGSLAVTRPEQDVPSPHLSPTSPATNASVLAAGRTPSPPPICYVWPVRSPLHAEDPGWLREMQSSLAQRRDSVLERFSAIREQLSEALVQVTLAEHEVAMEEQHYKAMMAHIQEMAGPTFAKYLWEHGERYARQINADAGDAEWLVICL